MTEEKEYSFEILTAEVSTADYVREFRDAPRFEGLCRACPHYGARWGCPPLSDDLVERYFQFPYLRIVASKVVPRVSGLPVGMSYSFLNAERRRLEPQLLAEEERVDGLSSLFTGMCFHCSDCTRPKELSCRHPEWVRPSLEALGFDLDATARRLLHSEILWGKEGKLPPYLLLIGGLFYK